MQKSGLLALATEPRPANSWARSVRSARFEIEFTSIGSLVDETAPAILGWGVGETRNVCSPVKLASGLSAVRTLIPGAQAPMASSVVVVRNRVNRMVFSCGV